MRAQVGRRDVVDEARQDREGELADTPGCAARELVRREAADTRCGSASPPSGARPSSRIAENGCGASLPRAARADVAHHAERFEPDAHDLAAHRRQRLDLGDRVDDALLDRHVREQDDVGLVLALGRLLLDHRVDRDLAIGEDARDVGEHAGPVVHAHAQVVAGLDLADRQERQVGELVGLEREMRHAMLGVGGVHARHVDEVGDDRARGRLGAGARAVVERRADGVALDQHRVHRAFDVGDQPLRRDQRRMHAQLDARSSCGA